MKDEETCCMILEANLHSMEAILKSMRIITTKFEHLEMRDSINKIEHNLVALFEQVELVQEVSSGVWEVAKENDDR